MYVVPQAHHERKKVNKFNTTIVRPEPFGYAQEIPVEGHLPVVLQVPRRFYFFVMTKLCNQLGKSFDVAACSFWKKLFAN